MMSGGEWGAWRPCQLSGVGVLAGLFWIVRRKSVNFALPMPNSIRVVRKILDLYVLVRIQVGQLGKFWFAFSGPFFIRS